MDVGEDYVPIFHNVHDKWCGVDKAKKQDNTTKTAYR